MRLIAVILLLCIGFAVVLSRPNVDKILNTQIAKANLEQIGEANEKSTLLGLKQAQLGGLVDGSVLAADKSPLTGVQAGVLEGVLGLVGGLLPS